MLTYLEVGSVANILKKLKDASFFYIVFAWGVKKAD